MLLIWESLLLERRSECCGIWFPVIKMKFSLSIYKENKTAKYCYLPIKLSKIYKWITNLLNVSHAMMVLTSLLVIEYRQKLGTVLLSEYIPLAMWPQLLSSRDGVYLYIFQSRLALWLVLTNRMCGGSDVCVNISYLFGTMKILEGFLSFSVLDMVENCLYCSFRSFITTLIK